MKGLDRIGEKSGAQYTVRRRHYTLKKRFDDDVSPNRLEHVILSDIVVTDNALMNC